MANVAKTVSTPPAGIRDHHAAEEGRLGQLFSRGDGCQNLIEPVVTYGYAVEHAGQERQKSDLGIKKFNRGHSGFGHRQGSDP